MKRGGLDARNRLVLRVRPADVSDAARIVQILRSEFPPRLLPYTIYGCHGLEQYTRQMIAHQQLGNTAWFVLCGEGSDLLGFTEIRRSVDSMFFNHAYVTASARGPGVGPSLLFHALSGARTMEQSRIALDVFHDNYTVRRGHRALGFREVCEQLWVELSLDDWAGPRCPHWYAGNLAQADRIHEEYGFSQFDLCTRSGSYSIGRLGSRLFRATDAAVLSDPCVPHALETLDPHRSLLCIDNKESLSDVMPPCTTVLARSLRMATDVDGLLERLLGFRRL
jgi:predicted GNAT family acetyltransferase